MLYFYEIMNCISCVLIDSYKLQPQSKYIFDLLYFYTIHIFKPVSEFWKKILSNNMLLCEVVLMMLIQIYYIS